MADTYKDAIQLQLLSLRADQIDLRATVDALEAYVGELGCEIDEIKETTNE